MKIKTLTLVFACAVGVSFGLLGIPTASAVTFNFNQAIGDLGPTHIYNSTAPTGFTVTADGFMTTAPFAGSLVGASPSNLFGKAMAGDENGVGLLLGTDNEISGNFIARITMGAGLIAPVTFQMNSTTGPDTWQVWGSNSATTGFTLQAGPGMDEASHPIGFFNFYVFQATVGDVLLSNMTAAAVPGPIVGAGLPGLIAACGALIALARRRRQRIA